MKVGSRYTNEDDDYLEGHEYIQGTGYITTLDTAARMSSKRKRRRKKIPFGFQAPQAKKKAPTKTVG